MNIWLIVIPGTNVKILSFQKKDLNTILNIFNIAGDK